MVEAANGKKATGDLRLHGPTALRWFLEQTVGKDKPGVLPGEKPAAPNSRRGILFPEMVRMDSSIWYVGRKGASFAEADLVGFLRNEERKRSCGTYRGKRTSRSFDLTLKDTVVTLRERATGKVVVKKTFRAKGACPRIAHSGSPPAAIVNQKVINRWMKRQVKK